MVRNKIHWLFLMMMFFLVGNASAQLAAPSKYIVYFTDKNNSPYSLNTPTDYLSQRAVNRRTAQQIAVSDEDLPVNPSYVNQIANAGAQVLNRSRWLNAVCIHTTDSNVINAIGALPYVQQISAVKAKAKPPVEKWNETFEEIHQLKNNIQLNHLSLQNFNYGQSFHQLNMIGVDYLHSLGFTGNGLRIAVLDAGFYNIDIYSSFDSLMADNRIVSTWDFVDGHPGVFEDHTHGMMVLSVMAGNQPGALIGGAPNAEYILLRTEDVASEYVIEEFNWLCAAEYADSSGADIINSSLGYTEYDEPIQSHVYADLNGTTAIGSIAAGKAAQKGILVVNSAGNSGNSPWYYIGVPADADNILAVGAVDSLENVASFSSRGPSYDGRVKPDLAAMGAQVTMTSFNGGIMKGNGTSFSSPLIAAAAACLWQANPTLTAMQLRQAILESCDIYNNPNIHKGHGIPDFAVAFGTVTQQEIPFRKSVRLNVYPNPADGDFTINYYSPDTQNIRIRIISIEGKLLFEQSVFVQRDSYNKFNISHGYLPGGMYLIEVAGKRQTDVMKLVKR
jgi:serine protease AprX